MHNVFSKAERPEQLNMPTHLADPAVGAIPVLRDIVEIRIGPDGERVSVPLDLEQLTERITADLVPHLRNELLQELQRQLDGCLDQALNTALQQVRRQVQRTLLTQLIEPDA